MDLSKAKELVVSQIAKDEKHIDYDYVVELADKYKKIITGKNIDTLLEQFVPREDAEMFEQRLRLTKSITGAVANKIRKPYYKVTRNKKVSKKIDITDKKKLQIVETMLSSFYGDALKKDSGLEGFMRTRFVDLCFTDSNAWVVTEWQAAKKKTDVLKPKPFIVSSTEAYNFSVTNNVTDWLLVKNDIKYLKYSGKMNSDNSEGLKEEKGVKFTHYGKIYTLVFTQVDKEWADKNIDLGEGEEIIEITENRYFHFKYYEPKVGFCPAFRVGYDRDLHTDGRTLVSPIEPAMPYFEKMIERVSELDLSMKLHVFPQKFMYAPRCEGTTKTKKCTGGKLPDGSVCGACKGTGFQPHTTAQDVIYLPLPEHKEDALDLSKMIHYAAPNDAIIKIQTEYIKELTADATGAIFNSDVFVQGKISKTATEKNIDMDSVYDTLSPFAMKFSEFWKNQVSIAVILAGLKITEITISHNFPSDLKLKTTGMLLDELKVVNETNAPSFVRQAISNDLAEIEYSDDPIGKRKYDVKRSFFPFSGKNADEIALAVTSDFVTRFDKILYFNFDKIFAELERDDKTFFVKDFNKQWEVVGEKVNAIIKDIEEGNADRFVVGDLTGANGGKNNGEGGENGNNSGGENGGNES